MHDFSVSEAPPQGAVPEQRLGEQNQIAIMHPDITSRSKVITVVVFDLKPHMVDLTWCEPQDPALTQLLQARAGART